MSKSLPNYHHVVILYTLYTTYHWTTLLAHRQLGHHLGGPAYQLANIWQPTYNNLSHACNSYVPCNREISESELQQSSSPDAEAGHAVPSISLVNKKFLGKYAISAEEFSEEMVSNIKFCIRKSAIRKEVLMKPIVIMLVSFSFGLVLLVLTFMFSGWG